MLSFLGALGIPPSMTGPAAESIVRAFLVMFQRLINEGKGLKALYSPELLGPVEEWIFPGDSPENYIPISKTEAERFDNAVTSLILISKPTTGAGIAAMTKQGAYPQIGIDLSSLFVVVNETRALLSHWDAYKRTAAKKTPWGWIVALTLGAGVTVAGGYWYTQRR